MKIYDRKANRKNSKKWDHKAKDKQNSKVEKKIKAEIFLLEQER